MSFKNYQ